MLESSTTWTIQYTSFYTSHEEVAHGYQKKFVIKDARTPVHKGQYLQSLSSHKVMICDTRIEEKKILTEKRRPLSKQRPYPTFFPSKEQKKMVHDPSRIKILIFFAD